MSNSLRLFINIFTVSISERDLAFGFSLQWQISGVISNVVNHDISSFGNFQD